MKFTNMNPNVERNWVVIDAEDKIFGRIITEIATILRGKNKPYYTPHVDCGDNVVIINAEKIRLTGNKWTDRQHFSHSGYPGGQKIQSPNDIMEKHPIRLIEHAVKGMLPKNRLGRDLFRNLYVYEGPEHKQEAQEPKKIDLNSIK